MPINDPVVRRTVRCERILGKRVKAAYATSNPDVMACRVSALSILYVNTRTGRIVPATAFQPSEVRKEYFHVFDHQGKSRMYVDAMVKAGYVLSDRPSRCNVVLADVDVAGKLKQIKRAAEENAKVFVYPHSARPPLWWDGWYPVWDGTTAVLVMAEGHAEVLRRIGYPRPVHVTGWSFCEMLPFQPCETVRNVLYMPTHPNFNGYLSREQTDINRQAFEKLVVLSNNRRINLTVRFLHDLKISGLREVEGVTYIKGKPDQSTQEIDAADVVVANQTAGYLAVARGKPLVGMGEDAVPISASSDKNFKRVRSWDKYREVMAYPLDILKGDTMELLNLAACGTPETQAWRERMIGDPFDSEKFIRIVEEYLHGHQNGRRVRDDAPDK